MTITRRGFFGVLAGMVGVAKGGVPDDGLASWEEITSAEFADRVMEAVRDDDRRMTMEMVREAMRQLDAAGALLDNRWMIVTPDQYRELLEDGFDETEAYRDDGLHLALYSPGTGAAGRFKGDVSDGGVPIFAGVDARTGIRFRLPRGREHHRDHRPRGAA